MTVSLKHTFQSAKTDSADDTLIQPSNWNEEHELTLATDKVLGRATAGTGPAEELSVGTALSVSGGTLAVTNVPVANGGTGASTLTGVVKGNGTSPMTAGTVSLTTEVSGTLPVANGGTGATTLPANNVLLGNGTSAVASVAPGAFGNALVSNGTTWASTPIATGVSFPQNIQSANYTLIITDAGKQIFHPASDTVVRTYTIPANSSVAFPIGTVVLFTVENSARPVNVAITTDTLVFGGGTTGTIVVPQNNTLMAIKVTATKWMANYLYQTGNAASITSIATANDVAPYISAYSWNSSTGFGAKYTDPSTLPGSNSYGVAFSPKGDAVAVSTISSPFITVYPWLGSGFGTKYANPATLPANIGNGVAFSPAGDAIAVAHNNSPFVTAYPWNSNTGFGTKYANPATLPVNTGNGVAFSPAGDAIAVAHLSSPNITAYPWNVSTGFGTKYTDPATLPTGAGKSVAFSPAGSAIAVAHTNSPYVSAYPWSGSGFGTKYADPGTLPGGDGLSVAFSPAGNAIAVGFAAASVYVHAYAWSGSGFGTKYANPATLPTGICFGTAFSPAGDAIAVGHNSSPYVTAYPWSGSGFGVKYSNPATLPGSLSYSVAFSPFS